MLKIKKIWKIIFSIFVVSVSFISLWQNMFEKWYRGMLHELNKRYTSVWCAFSNLNLSCSFVLFFTGMTSMARTGFFRLKNHFKILTKYIVTRVLLIDSTIFVISMLYLLLENKLFVHFIGLPLRDNLRSWDSSHLTFLCNNCNL